MQHYAAVDRGPFPHGLNNRRAPIRLTQACYGDLHRHPLKCVSHPDEASGHRYCLPNVARDGDGDGDQIDAADTAVRRIEGDQPAPGT